MKAKDVLPPLRDPLLDRISTDPAVCEGQPVIGGTGIGVIQLLDELAEGRSVPEILAAYPQLEEADVRAAIAHGIEAIKQVHDDKYNLDFELPEGTWIIISDKEETNPNV